MPESHHFRLKYARLLANHLKVIEMSALPNLKHLQYLIALHQHHHFHKAAEHCFVSQSTLSSAIMKLEEQFGCQLIERDNKSFIFTSHGLELVERSRQLLVNAQELMDYAKFQGDPEAGSIRLGCIPTIAPYLLPSFTQQATTDFPNLSLYLKEDTTENLMHQLSSGEIDLVVLALPIGHHAFKSKILGKDRFYMAGDKTLIDLYKKHKSYRCLPEHSIFLLSNEHCLTEHATSACQLGDATRVNQFSASSITTLLQMTAYHKGFTYLPEMAVKQGVGEREGMTIEPLDDSMYREIAMLWRPTSQRQQTYFKLAELLTKLI
mgnify:CR=1 FL=1